MKMAGLLVWGVSFLLWFLPVKVWQGLDPVPMLIAFSFPHFMATYVIWGTKRRSWKQEWPSLAFPVAFLGLCYLLEKTGNRALSSIPFHLTYGYLIYHFGQQTFGASLWGGYQLGMRPSPVLKRALQVWFLAVPFVSTYTLYAEKTPRVLFYYTVKSWSPPIVVIPYLYLMLGIVLLSVLFFMARHYQQHRETGVLWPIAMLSLPLIWFLPPFRSPYWIPIIPLLHALQYAPFWSRMLWSSTTPWWHKCLHYLAFVAMGWVVFRGLAYNINYFTGGAISYGAWIAMLNAHHFWIDGRIWKLSDEQNRALFTGTPYPSAPGADEAAKAPPLPVPRD